MHISLQRPSNWAEDLSEGPTKFPINLEAAGLKGGGLDLFEVRDDDGSGGGCTDR